MALGGEAGEKGFGYGAPIRVLLEGAPVDQVVVHTVGTRGFGHVLALPRKYPTLVVERPSAVSDHQLSELRCCSFHHS
jgi:hypothetical protein